MNVLQMNVQEIRDYIEEKMLENPMLEEGAADKDARPVFSEAYRVWRESFDLADDRNAVGETLREHLIGQIQLNAHSESVANAIRTLVQYIDDNGWLEYSTEELTMICGVSENDITKAMSIIQSLEPAGIGCRGLTDCLIKQVERKKGDSEISEIAVKIIKNDLEDLSKAHFGKLSKKYGIDTEIVRAARNLILSLDPRPGQAFNTRETVQFVFPDIIVITENDLVYAAYNDDCEPRLFINQYYMALLSSTEDKEVRKYLETKRQDAALVINNLEMRRNTLQKCVNAILEVQHDFFIYGEKCLKPLALKDIAEKTDLHLSTVGRAINGKYLQCRFGTFPLNRFFGRGAAVSDIDCYQKDKPETAADGVKLRIREIISNEQKKSPLSDQKISDELKKQGLSVSRRTVAKYREAMHIPVKSLRQITPDHTS